MSLLALKKHMLQVKITTLSSLCQLFQVEPETMRCLLMHWMRKGKIRQCLKTPACGTRCFKCQIPQIELYEWAEAAPG